MVGVVEKSNNAAGFANGAALTASGSGGSSGNAWDRFIVPGDLGGSGTSNTVVIETSPAPPSLPSGNKWMHLTQTNPGGPINVYWTMATARSQVWFDCYLQLIAAPASGSVPFVRFFTDAAYGSSAIAATLNLGSSRKFYINGGGASGSNSAAALTLGTVYYLVWQLDYVNLTATCNVYAVGSPTLVLTATMTLPSAVTAQSLRWGIGNADSGTEYRITNIRQGYGDMPARPDIVNSGPVFSASDVRRSFQAGSQVEMAWSATDPDNVQSLVVAWQDLPAGASAPTINDKSGSVSVGGTTATRTSVATLSAVGTYVAKATATDGVGATSVATHTLEMHPPKDVDTIIRQVLKGSFTVVGGLSNDAAGARTALSDGDANTGLDSVSTPTGMKGSYQLGPLGPWGIEIGHTTKLPNGGTLTRHFDVFLEDHTTKIYQTDQQWDQTTGEVWLKLDNTALASAPFAKPADIARAALWVDYYDTVV